MKLETVKLSNGKVVNKRDAHLYEDKPTVKAKELGSDKPAKGKSKSKS